MKKISIALLFLLALTSCGTDTATNPETSSSGTTLNTNTPAMKGTVTLDLNHALAGKTLKFDIEVMKISSGSVVASGSNIEVNYTGTLEDGTEFDSSYKRGEALAFTAGAGQMIPGFDKAVIDMKVGDKKSVTLPPSEAYGEYDATAIQEVPKENLKSFADAGYKLEAGEEIPTQFGMLKIIKVSE